MLARAFAGDPALSFIWPDRAIRADRLPALFRLFIDSDTDAGSCDVTMEGAAVALWRSPGRTRPGWFEWLRRAPRLAGVFGGALPRALAFDAEIARHHPRESMWYLHVLGCEPTAQGRGHGRAAMKPGLIRADRDRLPCLLETATEANVRFYEGAGFRVLERWSLPGGPPLWTMRRG